MNPILKQVKLAVRLKAIKNKLLHFALQGKTVKCVCCGSAYLTFLPAGIEKRANARCVRCGSLERHRALWLYFKESGLLQGKTIKLLHVAPEKIFYDHFRKFNNIEYYPIDLMPDKYAYGIKTIEMDITELKYQYNSFDAIICNHVLEHIRDDSKAMSEMYRVLKPGGWAILNTPVKLENEKTFEDVELDDPKKQLELFGQPDHVRIYGRDFLDRLASVGFKNEIINYSEKFSHNEQFRLGLKPSEVIFCSRK